jgi:membrane peptidoglycan carboxypeptidase
MGIILDDGVHRPPTTLERLSFAPGTPYHTVLEPPEPTAERVMAPVVAQTLRSVLADVVDHGTARRLRGAFVVRGDTIQVGGKTGSGDNRLQTFARGGLPLTSTPKSRTAAFAFYLGDRYYGVITASVMGGVSGEYSFTSSLPLAVLQLLAPAFDVRLAAPPERPTEAPKAIASKEGSRARGARGAMLMKTGVETAVASRSGARP